MAISINIPKRFYTAKNQTGSGHDGARFLLTEFFCRRRAISRNPILLASLTK
jgi:hypothetical protein